MKVKQLFSTYFKQNVRQLFSQYLEETFFHIVFTEAEVGFCQGNVVVKQQVFQMIDQGDPNEQRCPDD